jgi:hypothetical protein
MEGQWVGIGALECIHPLILRGEIAFAKHKRTP